MTLRVCFPTVLEIILINFCGKYELGVCFSQNCPNLSVEFHN